MWYDWSLVLRTELYNYVGLYEQLLQCRKVLGIPELKLEGVCSSVTPELT